MIKASFVSPYNHLGKPHNTSVNHKLSAARFRSSEPPAPTPESMPPTPESPQEVPQKASSVGRNILNEALKFAPLTNMLAGFLLLGGSALPHIGPMGQSIRNNAVMDRSIRIVQEKSASASKWTGERMEENVQPVLRSIESSKPYIEIRKNVDPVIESARPTTEELARHIDTVKESIGGLLENTVGDITAEQAQHAMVRAGWTMISLNTIFGNFNTIVLACKKKQPSYLGSGIWTFATAPILIFDASVPMRALLQLGYTMWALALANDAHNENNAKTEEELKNWEKPNYKPLRSRKALKEYMAEQGIADTPINELKTWKKLFGKSFRQFAEDPRPRQLDVTPLIYPKAMNSLLEDKNLDKTFLNYAKEWIGLTGRTAAFIGVDHGRMIASPIVAIQKAMENRKAKKQEEAVPDKKKFSVKKAITQTWDYLRGRKKKSPSFIRSTAMQNQVAGSANYSVFLPLLIWGHNEKFATYGFRLGAIPAIAVESMWLMKAIQHKDAKLFGGLIAGAVGGYYGATDWGAGLMQIGLASVQDHMRRHIDDDPLAQRRHGEDDEEEDELDTQSRVDEKTHIFPLVTPSAVEETPPADLPQVPVVSVELVKDDTPLVAAQAPEETLPQVEDTTPPPIGEK